MVVCVLWTVFMSKIFSQKILYIAIALCVGGIVGFYIPHAPIDDEDSSSELRRGEGIYTNELLECEIGRELISSSKNDFTSKLQEFLAKERLSKNISDVAVYYRDLNNGPISGFGHNDLFIPASLLKVPLLISVLRWAEENPNILETKITYEQRADFDLQTNPQSTLVIGKAYTARALLEEMIIKSDNQAALLLHLWLPKKYQEDLYTLLGIEPSIINDPLASISVKQYSIFFRILFNSSFLSQEYSEYALSLLTRTEFNEGLRATVPTKIPIAHKFGMRNVNNTTQQLHDCGIVYYPKHPYLLCIMTRGSEIEVLTKIIQDISGFVYRTIDAEYSD